MGSGASDSGLDLGCTCRSDNRGWSFFFFFPLVKTLNMLASPLDFFSFFFADSPSPSGASGDGIRSSEEASDMEVSDSASDVERGLGGLPAKSRVPGTDCWPGSPWKKVTIFSITLAQACKSEMGNEDTGSHDVWAPMHSSSKPPAVFLYFLLLKPPETLNTRSPTLPPPCSQLVSLGKEET